MSCTAAAEDVTDGLEFEEATRVQELEWSMAALQESLNSLKNVPLVGPKSVLKAAIKQHERPIKSYQKNY